MLHTFTLRMNFPAHGVVTPANTATAFMVLHWQEMFDHTTPDSYQPRLANTPSLIRELGDIAVRAQASEKWGRHVSILQEELKTVGESEADLLSAEPYYHWLIGQFCSQPIRKIPALATIAAGYEKFYRKQAAYDLRKAAGTLPKTKFATSRALRRWATIAIQNGCAESQLAALASEADLALSPIQFAEKLIDAVDCQPANFWCCLAIVGPRQDTKALARERGFDMVGDKVFVGGVREEFKKAAEADLSPDEAVTYVAHNESARDVFHASRQAIRAMRDAVDVCNFYSEAPNSEILPFVLTRTKAGHYEIVKMGEHDFRKRGARRARRLTMKTMDVVPRANLDGRILNALEHYNLAHFSSATRVKLVNLWTATECLTGSSNSIIGAVCDLVAPIVTWRRSDKILNYMTGCLNESMAAGNTNKLPAAALGKGDKVSRERLLLVLSRPTRDSDLVALFAFAADHPLWVFRLLELWELFHCPATLLKDLNQSQQRVRWQLYRIYRSRNLIVHEGHDTHLTVSLLDNLHYYFSITLSRILHGMQLRPGINVDGSIALWKSRSDYMLASLERDPSRLLVRDMFAQANGKTSTQPVWPKPAAPAVSP